MIPRPLQCLALLMAIGAMGCQATWQNLAARVTPLHVQYRQRAQAHQNAGELHQALIAYHVVLDLKPDDPMAKDAITALRKNITDISQAHYHRGLEYYKAGDFSQARRAFLTAIRINPSHAPSRHYLKTRLQNPSQATYKVRRGDSFIRIATKTYDDPSKAYLIAYFNGMNPQKPLLTGTILRLPAFDTSVLLPKSDIKRLLARAEKALAAKAYGQAADVADEILEEVAGHAKARRIADEARMQYGKRLMAQKRFTRALVQFKAVSKRHPQRNQAIKQARLALGQQALTQKLATAQGYLQSGEFSATIDAAEEILGQYPDNRKARMLLNQAAYASGKLMLEKGQEASAIERLNKASPTFEDTAQLISLARARTRATAETLYRDGVKHFINEDLENAIKAWQRALDLNPEHPKARQDMENAQRLLEKWKELEKPSPEQQ